MPDDVGCSGAVQWVSDLVVTLGSRTIASPPHINTPQRGQCVRLAVLFQGLAIPWEIAFRR
jgi:hypothetical protein